MNKRLVYESSYTWMDIRAPYDSRRSDRLFYVLVKDDSLEEARIYRNDIAVINFANQPCQGQLAAIETMQELLLGYCFSLPNGVIRVESVCDCFDCPPHYIPKNNVLKIGSVSWICRQEGNARITFGYRKVKALEAAA
jgi:hypothetical protein